MPQLNHFEELLILANQISQVRKDIEWRTLIVEPDKGYTISEKRMEEDKKKLEELTKRFKSMIS